MQSHFAAIHFIQSVIPVVFNNCFLQKNIRSLSEKYILNYKTFIYLVTLISRRLHHTWISKLFFISIGSNKISSIGGTFLYRRANGVFLLTKQWYYCCDIYGVSCATLCFCCFNTYAHISHFWVQIIPELFCIVKLPGNYFPCDLKIRFSPI